MKNSTLPLWLYIISGLLTINILKAQAPTDSTPSKYPQGYFRSPLDIPLYLAGNYGEIRSNHYHAGIDIKTEGVEGKKIYAAADGYVSRIKISEGGYGKALYITHPNGYTTVYAHLQRYEGAIEEYVKKQQYLKKSYEIELFPPKNQLKVKKGDVVAISGNTGGSGGPHLHFEIRETATEVPINPLLFGFDIQDNIPPILKHVTIYPIDDTSFVNRQSKPKTYTLSGKNGKYYISAKPEVKGIIGFGIEVVDKLNGSQNNCGIYAIELLIDNDTIYRHHVEDIPFHKTRYINCHVDYEAWKKRGLKIQRCYKLPNNNLDFYDQLKYNGFYMFTDDTTHQIKFIVKDSYQNTSTLTFKVKSSTDKILPKKTGIDTTKVYQFMKYNQENTFSAENIYIRIPKNALYQDINFQFYISPPLKTSISPVYHIHHLYEPLHRYMDVWITPSEKINIHKKWKDKVLAISLTEKKEILSPEGGHWDNNRFYFKTRNFGPYTLMVDTVPPRIRPFNIVPNRNMQSYSTIEFTISDSLSGIDSYKAEVDGKWILMEYEYKKNRLTHHLSDGVITPGKHKIKVTVTDKAGNVAEDQLPFSY